MPTYRDPSRGSKDDVTAPYLEIQLTMSWSKVGNSMGAFLHSDMSPFRLRFMPKPKPNPNLDLSKTMPKPNLNPTLNLSKTMPKPNLNPNSMSEWRDVGME